MKVLSRRGCQAPDLSFAGT